MLIFLLLIICITLVAIHRGIKRKNQSEIIMRYLDYLIEKYTSAYYSEEDGDKRFGHGFMVKSIQRVKPLIVGNEDKEDVLILINEESDKLLKELGLDEFHQKNLKNPT